MECMTERKNKREVSTFGTIRETKKRESRRRRYIDGYGV